MRIDIISKHYVDGEDKSEIAFACAVATLNEGKKCAFFVVPRNGKSLCFTNPMNESDCKDETVDEISKREIFMPSTLHTPFTVLVTDNVASFSDLKSVYKLVTNTVRIEKGVYQWYYDDTLLNKENHPPPTERTMHKLMHQLGFSSIITSNNMLSLLPPDSSIPTNAMRMSKEVLISFALAHIVQRPSNKPLSTSLPYPAKMGTPYASAQPDISISDDSLTKQYVEVNVPTVKLGYIAPITNDSLLACMDATVKSICARQGKLNESIHSMKINEINMLEDEVKLLASNVERYKQSNVLQNIQLYKLFKLVTQLKNMNSYISSYEYK